MPIVSLFSWWYGDGWARLAQKVLGSAADMLELFSVGLLLATLFAPFRQIAVGQVRGSLDARLRAWGDLQISRLIGAMVRLVIIIVGLGATLLALVFGIIGLLLWLLVPAVPLIALLLVVGFSR